MAFKNETITDIEDLITKLDTFLSSNGWTPEHLDISPTFATGGEWAMKNAIAGNNLRFAASWDAVNSGTVLCLYQYVDQDYVIGDRPWGQDHDSGNGKASTTTDLTDERHVDIGSSPIQYWCFSEANYAYVIVETSPGVCAHFGFGFLDKRTADWTGGAFVYGQYNSASLGAGQAKRDGRSNLLDGYLNDTLDPGDIGIDMELHAATIHCEGLPNQPAGGMFAVSVGGRVSSAQTEFGTDRQSNDGSSSDIARVGFPWGYRAGSYANGFNRTSHTDLSGEVRMWPISPTYVDSNGNMHGAPIGHMPDVFGCSIEHQGLGDEITDGTETYVLFPANKKYSGSGAETGTSGYLGIAYLKDTKLDPQFHPGVEAHWDFNDSSTVTVGGGRVEDITDGSSNSNTLSDKALNFGPLLVTVDGMDLGRFSEANLTRLVADDHASLDFGTGSFTVMFVIRSSGFGPLAGYVAAKGVFSTGLGQYDININRLGTGALGMAFGNFDIAQGVAVDDPSTGAVTGRLMVLTVEFDRAEEVVNFYKNGVLSPSSGADISAAASNDNDRDFVMGRQTQGVGEYLDGDIGELAIIRGIVTPDEMTGMHDYLIDKWSIVTGLPTLSPTLNPATLAVIGHWDFSDASSITEVSNKISAIADQVATNALTQSDAGRRPILAYRRGSLMAHFAKDGIEDWLSTAGDSSPTDLSDIGTNSVLYIAVFRAERDGGGPSTGNTVFQSGELVVNHARFFAQWDTSDFMNCGIAEDSEEVDSEVSEQIVLYRTVVFSMYVNREASPDELTVHFNGVETLDSGKDISALTPLNNTVPAGDAFLMGTMLPGQVPTGANFRFEGGIGELIVIEDTLTSTQIVNIHHHLMNKWDVTAGSGGWNGDPQYHPGVAAHWDFDDATSVTVGAGRVEDITDGSPNTNDLSDKTLNFGPVLVTVDGRDFGRFSQASTTRLVADHHASLDFGSGSFTVIFVIRSSGFTFHQGYVLAKGAEVTTEGQYDININKDGGGHLTGTTGDFTGGPEVGLELEDDSTGAVTGRLMVLTVEFDRVAEEVNFYKNGVLSPSSGEDISTASSHTNTKDLIMGRQSQNAGQYLDGDIGEIAIIGGIVTSEEMTSMHAYLLNKWSIVTGLPVHSPTLDPATLTGRIGHWDFSDASSITEVANKISQIDDQETTNDLTQSTAARRPILAYRRGSLMGYFSKDGLEDWLSTAGVIAPTDLADIGTNSVLYVCVFRAERDVSATNNGNTVFISGENGWNHARVFGLRDNNDGVDCGVAESVSEVNSVDNAEDCRWRTVVFSMYVNREASPDELTVHFNGVESADSGRDISGISPLNNVGNAFDGFILGTLLPGDATFGTKFRFEGGIAEVIVIEEAVTSTQIVNIHHHLMNKWDVTT